MPYIQSQRQQQGPGSCRGWTEPSRFSDEANQPTIDPLTGLPGLKEFYRLGTPLVADCLAAGVDCAVAIIDIDHFRRINDIHCQETGDLVLKALASKLETLAAGGRHVVARLGEEEFAMLLVGVDGPASTEFCEGLRRLAAATPVCTDSAVVAITVSVGVAEIYGPETFDNYLNAAEQFLFMAKSSGRNRVFSDHIMETMV